MGVTDAFFQDLGNLPDFSDLLKSFVRGPAMRSAHILRSLVGILSGPDDLFASKPLRI